MASQLDLQSDRRWRRAALGTTLIIALLSGVAGFVWFPLVQGAAGAPNVWQAICAAAGLSRVHPAEPPIPADKANSTVILNAEMFQHPSTVSIGRGATLAQRCAICHGARSPSQADTPDLSGQFATVIYKELQDFRSGARVNAVMTPQVTEMSDQDVLDLAAYYSYLPPAVTACAVPAPAIVASGAPMRNVPPCGSCHGMLTMKPGAPRLVGESASYIRTQLNDFDHGERHNDISQQMRNIARRMTRTEIEASAHYYSCGSDSNHP